MVDYPIPRLLKSVGTIRVRVLCLHDAGSERYSTLITQVYTYAVLLAFLLAVL